jgi:hypothetical protein
MAWTGKRFVIARSCIRSRLPRCSAGVGWLLPSAETPSGRKSGTCFYCPNGTNYSGSRNWHPKPATTPQQGCSIGFDFRALIAHRGDPGKKLKSEGEPRNTRNTRNRAETTGPLTTRQMLPELNAAGDLPTGVHPATWAELSQRFGAEAGRRGACTRRLAHIRIS